MIDNWIKRYVSFQIIEVFLFVIGIAIFMRAQFFEIPRLDAKILKAVTQEVFMPGKGYIVCGFTNICF